MAKLVNFQNIKVQTNDCLFQTDLEDIIADNNLQIK